METDYSIRYQLRFIYEKYRVLANDTLRQADLTFSQLIVLDFLFRQPQGAKVSQKDIARGVGLEHTTVIGLLKRLGEKGMVTVDVDPENRKYRVIEVTPKALETKKTLDVLRDEMEGMLLRNLTREEVNQLGPLLQKVLDSVSEELNALYERRNGD